MATTSKKTPGLHYLSKIVAAIKEKLKAGNLTETDLDGIVKSARSHAGGKAKAEKMKADTAALVAFEQQFEAAEAGGNQTGLMICFYLSDDAAARLAIPQGESHEDLHLTLCYLGDSSQFGEIAIAEILIACRNHANWQTPLSGVISGTGRFIGDEIDVYYASVDIPMLAEFRTDLARRLASCGTPAKTEHGFDPHITLAYLEKDDPTPDYDVSDIELRFDTMSVMIAGRRVDLPMAMSSNFNEVADLCNQSGPMRLFMEQQFADAPEWINYLPKPGVYTSPRYGQITITKERNQSFVDNFLNEVYQKQLPIDNEHDLAQSGASGWITSMKINDDGGVDAKTEWTDRGKKLIEEERFKYFSPAWFDSWTDPVNPETRHKNIAIGGALCIRPFFKENALRPIVANEQGLSILTGDVPENLNSSDTVNLHFEALTPVTDQQGASDMTQSANPTPQQFTELETKFQAAEKLANEEKARADAAEAKLNEQKQAAEAATTELTKATESVTKLNERVASLEKDKRTSRFTEISRNWIGERQGHIDMLELIVNATEKGEESTEFKAYVESQNAAVERVRTAGLFTEAGSTAPAAGGAIQKIEAKARKMAEDSAGQLSYEAAMTAVLEAEPQLYKEHLAEMRGGAVAG